MKYFNSFNKLLLLFVVCLVTSISGYADDGRHTLKVVSKPEMAGSFNKSSASLLTGEMIHLYAYANPNFTFKEWTAEDGTVITTAQDFEYAMPAADVTLTAVYEYNPANPANPAVNAWYPSVGSVVVDDFAVGSLSKAITNAIGKSKSSEVLMVTVAGVMNNNDFNVINNYTNCTLLDISRVTGVVEVPSYAFDYTNLESVYLPSTIEKIGYRAFYDCKQLTALTVYAMVPPALENQVFTGVQNGLVVYVPAAAIAQYQDANGWKDFTLLPIQEDIRNISVSLPQGAKVSDYAQMWLELTNTKSGQKMHYVMTDRTTYTFANIIRNTSWNAVLRNQRGDVFGNIDNIDVKDEDVSVTFSSLSKPQNISLSVKMPDGSDVTAKTQVTWVDAEGNYIAQSTGLSGLVSGYAVSYRVTLPQDLAMQFVVPQQKDYIVRDGNNNLTLTLEPIKQVTISGSVKDFATNAALSGATVSVSQTFGGKYSKTVNTKTDAKGNYALTVSNVPTSLAVSASGYISQTMSCESIMNGEESIAVSDISLKEISGAVINLGVTYTKCPEEEADEDTFQEWYADYNNIAYCIYNKTKQKTVSQFNVQYPQIVLLEDVDEGDVLELTATSKVNAFMPVKATATINAEQNANAAFNIVELGKIKSTFVRNSNASVVGSLYDANGKLVKSYDYSNASLTINDLADGRYTLVTMGSSKLFNTIYDLSQLPQTGLVLGADYTQTSVEVKSGNVSVISIAEVPSLNESKLYYTGDNTSFTVNKSSIVAGNYLTLTGYLDFKSAYAANVSNVNLIVDLPESCEFVENSVMVGNSTSSYILQNNRITIPIAHYTDRVRFCIIPTLGGEYAPSALAQFDLDGETITQPIGSANYTAKDLSITVPSTVAKTTIPVSGTAVGASSVEIYDGDVLIGQTTSMANGTWSTTCELNEPYNLSKHNIYAKVTTKAGMALQSENVLCTYNKDAIEARTVKMSFYNAWMSKNVEVLWDFENYKRSADSYSFYNGTDLTFEIDLTNNDTTIVTSVDLYVYTSKNNTRKLEAKYNDKVDKWIAVGRFESSDLPVNVNVEFWTNTTVLADRNRFTAMSSNIDGDIEKANNLIENVVGLYDETERIGKDIERKAEKREEIFAALQSATSESDRNKLLNEFMENADLSSTDADYEVIVPDVVDEDYIKSLIATSQALLEKNVPHDAAAVDELLSRADEMILGFDESVDTDTSFKNFLDNDFSIKSDDGEYDIKRGKLSDFKYYEYNITDTITLPMTDKSNLIIYLCEDNDVVILDSLRDEYLSVKNLETLSNVKAMLRSRVLAKGGDSFISILNEAREKTVTTANILEKALMSAVSVAKDHISKLEAASYDIESTKVILEAENAVRLDRIINLERQIREIESESVSSMHAYFSTVEQRSLILKLQTERNEVLKQIDGCNKSIGKLDAKISTLGGKIAVGTALVGQLMDAVDIVKGLFDTVKYIAAAITDHGHWHSLIDKIEPCPDDAGKAKALVKQCKDDLQDIEVSKGYIPAFAISGIATAVNGVMFVNKTAKFLLRFVVSTVTNYLTETSKGLYERAKDASVQKYAQRYKEYRELKCKKDEDPDDPKSPDKPKSPQDDEGDKPQKPSFDPLVPIQDPSGFVYEGVFSNRLEGVTATCFYKEMVEDMYGDLHENIVKWDAEEYAQENPLFTDENGYYRWDVPQGLWQVKFEKEGYETTCSDWLPVPPPQLEVNIAMKQNVQPNVKSARAYEDAVVVEFDKYMMPELLNKDNIIVMAGGKQVEGSVELLNEEVKYEGETETFASKLRFNAKAPFEGDEVTLMVNNRVKSYAGIRMQDDYSQAFTIEQEIRKIVCDSAVVVGYGYTGNLPVTVLPASASAGKTLTVRSSSSAILGTDVTSIKLDENGTAMIPVSGELPGTAALTFNVDGYDITATAIVNVEDIEYKDVMMPKASIASGTTVDKGTKVTLFCETEGATIYYTLDGSCPCDEATRLVYTEPLVISEDVTIKAMAVAEDMTESDIVEFTYIVDKGVGIDDVTIGDDLRIYPLPVRDKLNVSAGGKIIKSVSLNSMNGSTVVTAAKRVTHVTLDVSSLASGIYVVNVATEDKTYSRKIMKVE